MSQGKNFGRRGISLIIRAKNEAALFRRCLEAVFSQNVEADVDVLLIDSGSTDGTLEIAREFPRVRIHEIPPESFNYGAALNLGVSLTNAEFVVPLSAHCIPVNNSWLQTLLTPLIEDPTLAGTFSRQIAWPDNELRERRFLEGTFGEQPSIQRGTGDCPDEFAPLFSNASCCIRTTLAREVPFPLLSYAEDRVWAYQLLKRGYGIAYQPDSKVYHSHHRSLRTMFHVAKSVERARVEQTGHCSPVTFESWNGPRRLWWTWCHWHSYAAESGLRGIRAFGAALHATAGTIVADLGRWSANRPCPERQTRPTTPSPRPVAE